MHPSHLRFHLPAMVALSWLQTAFEAALRTALAGQHLRPNPPPRRLVLPPPPPPSLRRRRPVITPQAAAPAAAAAAAAAATTTSAAPSPLARDRSKGRRRRHCHRSRRPVIARAAC